MIGRLFGDAFRGLSCPFSFSVLQCSAGCRYSPLTTGPCSQCCPLFNWGCIWVWHCSSSICGCIMRLYIIRCNPMQPLYGVLPLLSVPVRVTSGALVAHRYSCSIGVLLAAEQRDTAGLIVPSQCLCGTIFLTLHSMVWGWRVQRAGPMLFIGLGWSITFCLRLFPISISSFFL